MVSGVYSAGDSYRAARQGAAILDRSERAWIVMSGNDRRSYLQGLLTNDVENLQAGQGCYAAYLTPQGRMIADLWVYELGDVVLLSVARDVRETVLMKLDQFVFTEDVKVGDVSNTFAALAIVGPQAAQAAASALTGVSRDALAALPEHGNVRAEFRGQPAIVLRVTDTGEPGFDILTDVSQRQETIAALQAAGAVDADGPTAEALRIEAGIPKFHCDMDEDTIPLEAGIESRAISLTKGCYVGQEVIIRVLHRGHGRVARKLVGLTIDGENVPPAGAPVRPVGRVKIEAREIGHVTSSALSPALQRPVALAYVHRDYVTAGTTVTVGDAPATVTPLPFVPRQV
jgi:folate-binding protein YgfZ